MKSIVLIGMPGVGKSTLGVVLAKILGMRFIDSDLVIQEQTGKRLSILIKENGPEGFCALENRINRTICDENAVIATGGSAVYGKEAMEHFKEFATLVYLKISLPDVSRRLGDLDERGVVHLPGQTLEDIYAERSALYEKYADIVVETTEGDFRGTLDRIIAEIKR